ncbi:hypothetical protein HHL19_35255 [Streptomyces sp. R302]|uniref:hypothetical protein n=1 Tax=unclassified Streptomyces TaxID=2593676 RepID=UPI00145E7E3C|nr:MULTISPECIES: hypothetical protein [unclassified Streptomyces]NML55200.1 hypothetical protein [Streptomyces sp. R301]NML83770.1 hypothetical protein [Streptomyces sp. R302]
MNKNVIGATGLALVAAMGIGGYAYLQQDEDVHVEALCNPTQTDAAEAARAQNLALVDVVERGRLVSKGPDAGMQTFKVRTLAVYKGTLPTEAEVGLPEASAVKLQPGSRYEVSVLGPEDGTWIARFTRPVPAGKTADALAAHWKTEIGKQFVEPPCSDTTTAP